MLVISPFSAGPHEREASMPTGQPQVKSTVPKRGGREGEERTSDRLPFVTSRLGPSGYGESRQWYEAYTSPQVFIMSTNRKASSISEKNVKAARGRLTRTPFHVAGYVIFRCTAETILQFTNTDLGLTLGLHLYTTTLLATTFRYHFPQHSRLASAGPIT